MPVRRGVKDFLILCSLTIGALLLHGYHPYVEDSEIYLPAILKRLHPSLFPYNDAFFTSHAHMTAFPNVIAYSIRLLRISVPLGLLAWQIATIFMLLYGCWRIARIAFQERYAAWCGVALVAALLTMPVAGTSLYIMDQYVTARSLSTPAGVLAVAAVMEESYIPAALWMVLAFTIHPLMAIFPAAFIMIVAGVGRRPRPEVGLRFARNLFPPLTGAYDRVLQTRSYFFLTRWAWFEWVGVFAPLALLEWFQRIAERRSMPRVRLACGALIFYQTLFFLAALVVSMPGRFEIFAELQPLRSLHLLYILLFVFAGGFLAIWTLHNRPARWILFFAPVCFTMWFAQRQLFPATPHLEWPWTSAQNPWVQAFEWVHANTPENAYFALDPDHMVLPGEDQHGFRAIAQRSMLADAVKDSGAATMFPELAGPWEEQVQAQKGWTNFQLSDLLRLKQRYGVNWVIDKPGIAGLTCPYRNATLVVCRVE